MRWSIDAVLGLLEAPNCISLIMSYTRVSRKGVTLISRFDSGLCFCTYNFWTFVIYLTWPSATDYLSEWLIPLLR